MAWLTQLTAYPVKSMSGLDLERLEIGPHGPTLDRKWQVVALETGQTLTQREHPELSVVRPHLGSQNDASDLGLEFPNGARVALFPDSEANHVQTQVWSYDCLAQPGCAEANEAISDYLGCYAQLVYGVSDRNAGNGQAHARFRGFADKYALLLLNSASLNTINGALEAEHSDSWPKAIDLSRFRGNVAIEGAASGLENETSGFLIGGHEFEATDHCGRCKVTRIDQESGHVRDKTLAKILRQWKFVPGLGAVFGQYMTRKLPENGTILLSVGDEIRFL